MRVMSDTRENKSVLNLNISKLRELLNNLNFEMQDLEVTSLESLNQILYNNNKPIAIIGQHSISDLEYELENNGLNRENIETLPLSFISTFLSSRTRVSNPTVSQPASASHTRQTKPETNQLNQPHQQIPVPKPFQEPLPVPSSSLPSQQGPFMTHNPQMTQPYQLYPPYNASISQQQQPIPSLNQPYPYPQPNIYPHTPPTNQTLNYPFQNVYNEPYHNVNPIPQNQYANSGSRVPTATANLLYPNLNSQQNSHLPYQVPTPLNAHVYSPSPHSIHNSRCQSSYPGHLTNQHTVSPELMQRPLTSLSFHPPTYPPHESVPNQQRAPIPIASYLMPTSNNNQYGDWLRLPSFFYQAHNAYGIGTSNHPENDDDDDNDEDTAETCEKITPESNVPESDICKICLEKRINCVFIECGHLASCLDCSRKLRNCPICRQHIKKTIKVYKT